MGLHNMTLDTPCFSHGLFSIEFDVIECCCILQTRCWVQVVDGLLVWGTACLKAHGLSGGECYGLQSAVNMERNDFDCKFLRVLCVGHLFLPFFHPLFICTKWVLLIWTKFRFGSISLAGARHSLIVPLFTAGLRRSTVKYVCTFLYYYCTNLDTV